VRLRSVPELATLVAGHKWEQVLSTEERIQAASHILLELDAFTVGAACSHITLALTAAGQLSSGRSHCVPRHRGLSIALHCLLVFLFEAVKPFSSLRYCEVWKGITRTLRKLSKNNLQ
jgi:hypothetical protein